MFTVLHARLRPYTPQIGLRLIDLHLQICMISMYICIHTSAHIYLYMITYIYICLHTASFIYLLLRFTYFYTQGLLSPYSTIYLNAHIPIYLYILLRPNMPYTYLHNSTPTYVYFLTYYYDQYLYIITFIYAHVRPIHVYPHLRIYTTQTSLHTSTVIHAVHMFTYYRAHIRIYDNILLRPYTSLEAYTPINLYMFTYLFAHILTHVYMYAHIGSK